MNLGGYYYGSTLFCNDGYYESGASCLKAPAHATAYGGTSFYCESGYYRDGGECRSLPDHAYALGESWQCSSGYFKQGDRCVAPEHGRLLGSWLYCDTGYVVSNKGFPQLWSKKQRSAVSICNFITSV